MHPDFHDRRPGLKPPRFRLASMLWMVAALCVLLVIIRASGPLGGSALILLLLAVMAHVAGNALGTQLRINGDRAVDEHGNPIRRITARAVLKVSDYAPKTQLGIRKSLGKSAIVLTAIGAIGGAAGGCWLLLWANIGQATLANMTLGTLSCAVLGALWGFWASSFLQVFLGALLQAHRESQPTTGVAAGKTKRPTSRS